MKKVALIVPYFGKLPNYFPLFLKSCAANPQIDWLIFADHAIPQTPSNVTVIPMTFEQLKSRIAYKLNTQAPLFSPYKLCDYKPTYGKVFSEYISEYDFWGHCDIDLIFGDLSQYITEELLEQHDKLFIDGHLILYRNIARVNNAFDLKGEKESSFRYCIQFPEAMYFDEGGIIELFEKYGLRQYHKPQYADVLPQSLYFRNILFGDDRHHKNQYFKWSDGRVYKCWEEDGQVKQREYSYIHFQKRNFPLFDSALLREKEFIISQYGFSSATTPIETTRADFKQVYHYHLNRLKGITPTKVKRTLKGIF